MKYIICDLDGTLSDGRHRLHLLPPPETRMLDEAWLEFNKAGQFDPPISDTIELVNFLSREYYLVILTGRGEAVRDITEKWLYKNQVFYDKLIMRKKGDCRLDVEVKREVLEDIGFENILCAFDDLPHIVDAFRSWGITTYEVTKYDNNDEYVHANKKAGITNESP